MLNVGRRAKREHRCQNHYSVLTDLFPKKSTSRLSPPTMFKYVLTFCLLFRKTNNQLYLALVSSTEKQLKPPQGIYTHTHTHGNGLTTIHRHTTNCSLENQQFTPVKQSFKTLNQHHFLFEFWALSHSYNDFHFKINNSLESFGWEFPIWQRKCLQNDSLYNNISSHFRISNKSTDSFNKPHFFAVN